VVAKKMKNAKAVKGETKKTSSAKPAGTRAPISNSRTTDKRHGSWNFSAPITGFKSGLTR
jgi:hypothetical protein